MGMVCQEFGSEVNTAWKRIDSSTDHTKGEEIIVEEEVEIFEDHAVEDGIETFLGQESKSTSIMVRGEHWALSSNALMFSSQGV
ncbi:hypothetical protein AAES_84173 [Amazona aestiva]|uniref:Uncharacterized protein n=1 Tax=Amazona aestiva TaxID=12930 RepID=A0A0Q3MF14_AMAAE|nr:hypothetical protein AAES_84173 [Amazona aestiva]